MIMEAVRTSETSVYFNGTTWCYIPESCSLHTRRLENLEIIACSLREGLKYFVIKYVLSKLNI
jgi:hypothetical protein